MNSKSYCLLFCLVLAVPVAPAQEPGFPVDAKRILFLGDSITHAGHYIALIDAQLHLAGEQEPPELINLGLPSETCSGLSEPEHPFPRPNVHERLTRALAKVQPDVVVACYGMNDGIYYPFSEERFAAYREGVNKIIDKVQASGAKLILMTPPAFDALPLKNKGKLLPAGADQYSWKQIYENYDDVLRRYAEWVRSQSDRVAMVIDLHTPVTQYVAERRRTQPGFTMSPDGVHVNQEGHQVLASAILESWGFDDYVAVDEGLMTLIQQQQKVTHDAWLSEVGHLRPGVKEGLPKEQAAAEAAEFERQIRERAAYQRNSAEYPDPTIHRVHFPASKRPNELSLFVDYFLWIPPGVDRIRGIIVHQHGCGAGASSAGLTAANDLHWRSLAQRWDFALLGSAYEARVNLCRDWCDPRKGSRQRFLQALDHFAKSTGHAEIDDVPWCIWGHSGGGFWASLMQASDPDRIAAIWLQSGTAFASWDSGEIPVPSLSDATYQVPVMGCPGLEEKTHERFHRAWDGLHAMMKVYRQHGAPFGMAADPASGHDCGDSRYLAIPFFDECLKLRLPVEGESENALRPIDMTKSMFASLSDRTLVTRDASKDDLTELAWLPSQSFAKKWLQFTSTGAVDDDTPPPTPHAGEGQRNDVGVALTWHAHADFESGISGFRITRNGETIVQLPEKPVGRFGRPIFQAMSYSDTPEQPVPPLRWTDESAPNRASVAYQVFSINSVGLESQPLEIVVSD